MSINRALDNSLSLIDLAADGLSPSEYVEFLDELISDLEMKRDAAKEEPREEN